MKADMSNRCFAVSQIQQWILFLSRVDDKIMRVNPDGIYGPETEVAVRKFQLTRGLTPTGTVDFITWQRLKADYYSAKVSLGKSLIN